jgi:hypothetical protein
MIVLLWQRVTPIVSHQRMRPDDLGVIHEPQQPHRRGTTALSLSIPTMKRPTPTCLTMARRSSNVSWPSSPLSEHYRPAGAELQQVGMGTGPDKPHCFVCDVVDQQPVWLYMTVPASSLLPRDEVRVVVRALPPPAASPPRLVIWQCPCRV